MLEVSGQLHAPAVLPPLRCGDPKAGLDVSENRQPRTTVTPPVIQTGSTDGCLVGPYTVLCCVLFCLDASATRTATILRVAELVPVDAVGHTATDS